MQEYKTKAIKKLRFISKLFISLPFVRCVVLNGSLATGNFKKTSDIDLLIIAKDGRIFTTRFLTVGLVKILGLKRPKDERKSHAGKFCLNHYLTESYLHIPTGRGDKIDRYCAETHSRSILAAGDKVLFKKFLETNNQWWQKYLTQNPKLKNQNLQLTPSGQNSMFQKLLEFCLAGKVGDRLERELKDIQIQSIESDSRTKQYPNLIVYNDEEMRFHPPKKNNL